MAAGYDLKKGKYNPDHKTKHELKTVFLKFFRNSSKKESTYKYVMMQTILERCNENEKKVSFDLLFSRFSEIYWILVYEHHIPQKVSTLRAPETLAEKIVFEVAREFHVEDNCSFGGLPELAKYELIRQMKKKCSKYVFGALFEEMDKLFFSFSKEKEWIIINPLMMEFVKEHYEYIVSKNFRAWANFYANIIVTGRDEIFYYRLLEKSFFMKSNKVKEEPVPQFQSDELNCESKKSILEMKDTVSNKVRKLLIQYPNIGLYVAQISDLIGENKEQVRWILDHAFWSRREESRYYYKEVSDECIIHDALFQDDISDEIRVIESDTKEMDEKYYDLLDDPELLIKVLLEEKSTKSKNKNDEMSNVPSKNLFNDKVPCRWEREEVVILVVEYFKSKGLSTDIVDESYREISNFLRKRRELITGCPVDDIFRNYAGIRMQASRIRCLDPETHYSGMQGTKLQQEVVNQYIENPEKLIKEAEDIYRKYNICN